MRHFLTIYFLLIAISAQSQSDTLITFSQIQKADSIKSSELFYRAQIWVNDNFKSGKDVVQVSDKENGTLTGKGVIKIPYKYKFYGNTSGETDYSFSFKILIKDEKYKCEFSNFENISGFKGAIDYRIGRLTSSAECPIKWEGWPQRAVNEIWVSTKDGLTIRIADLKNSLRLAMLSKKSEADF